MKKKTNRSSEINYIRLDKNINCIFLEKKLLWYKSEMIKYNKEVFLIDQLLEYVVKQSHDQQCSYENITVKPQQNYQRNSLTEHGKLKQDAHGPHRSHKQL